jgi:hypothetical protein
MTRLSRKINEYLLPRIAPNHSLRSDDSNYYIIIFSNINIHDSTLGIQKKETASRSFPSFIQLL